MLVVIFFAVISIQFLFSMMEGAMGKMLNDLFDDYGHVVYNVKGYREKQKLYPLDFVIEDSEKLIEDITNIPAVKSIRSNINFGAMAEGAEYSYPVICQGISIGDDRTSKRYRDHIIEGSMITPEGNGVLIGDELSESLGRKTGDTLMLLIQDFYGSPNPVELTVKGIINTHIKIERASMVILPLQISAELLNLPGDTITIQVNIDDRKSLDRILGEVPVLDEDGKQILDENGKPKTEPGLVHNEYEKQFRALTAKYGLEMDTYLDKYNGLLNMLKFADIFMIITYVLFIVIASVTIINTVLTSVFERFRDFGTMRAIGLGKTGLFSVILLEAALNSLAAVILVNLVTIPWFMYLNVHGWDFKEAGEVMQGLSSVIYFSCSPSIFIYGSLVGILSGVLSALYPALIAVKKNVVEALRYV